MKISFFEGKYAFLSNFYIEPDGTCVEVEYQKAKCKDQKDLTKFDFLYTHYSGRTIGSKAKQLGKKVAKLANWEEIKLKVMINLVSQKFIDHPDLLRQLKSTSPHILEEGNNWGDIWWGICDGVGENHLGKILMGIRG